MSGGNIICRDVETADKSGSALSGVLDEIESLPEWTGDPALTKLFARIRGVVTCDGVDAEWIDYVEITSLQARSLMPLFELAKQRLVDCLGTSDPIVAMDREESVDGFDYVAAKWGAGRGWRLYCLIDLVKASAHSIETGESIYVAFS